MVENISQKSIAISNMENQIVWSIIFFSIFLVRHLPLHCPLYLIVHRAKTQGETLTTLCCIHTFWPIQALEKKILQNEKEHFKMLGIQE